ncbi:MAG: hypothetical protein PHR21_02870 [Oscillospiraceae bacterium]|nr:hypothetical protein [Oscillospiraceae bacterium]MDD4368552.1 hypothetical protein [Oscillospiraceae bacterium]
MQGLRTKENPKFLNFFEQVQKEAAAIGCVFFLDFGECKDIPFENMEIDDISGWLIPNSQSSHFEALFSNDRDLGEFEKFYTWCIPSIENGTLRIEFRNFT